MSVAFELTTAAYNKCKCIKCALGVMATMDDYLCKKVNLLRFLTLGVNQNLFVLFFELMVAKYFYLSLNLFPGFGYGKPKINVCLP